MGTGAHVRTRSRLSGQSADGFTLIELLVVMIILGVLAGIAVPVFLRQRAKAHDAATKADVNNLGKEIATYFIGGAGPLSLSFATPGEVAITDGGYTTFARLTIGSTAPSSGGSSNLNDPMGWCVALTDPQGDRKTFSYSALNGLGEGACT